MFESESERRQKRNKNLRIQKKIKKNQSLINYGDFETFKPNLTFLTGAGISKESGLSTFRDSDGLWDNHSVYDVASINGFRKNPLLVNQFYNERRKDVENSKPNQAHLSIKELEECYNVNIITQNIDDLHERAGSTNVFHLHGFIKEARSSSNPKMIYDIGYREILENERCKKDNSVLRPNVVFFGEPVDGIPEARRIISQSHIFVVIGTSLKVNPAAELVHYVPKDSTFIVIDPAFKFSSLNLPERKINLKEMVATEGMLTLKELLIQDLEEIKRKHYKK